MILLKIDMEEDKGNDKITSTFVKHKRNEESKSKSDSISGSISSSSSKAIRLFNNHENPSIDNKENLSKDHAEKRRKDQKKDKLENKKLDPFPSFDSDERDENVPRL